MFTETNHTFIIQVPATYSNTLLHKCFYWYTGKFDVVIRQDESFGSIIQLTSLAKELSVADKEQLSQKINKDLIDFLLREKIFEETKTIRELIIAKAFANFETDAMPLSNVSDPVGFDPKTINVNDSY